MDAVLSFARQRLLTDFIISVIRQQKSDTTRPTPPVDDADGNENIFLFAPNLIRYLRVVLATCSIYLMPIHPRWCSLLYAMGCILDAPDGVVARTFNQSTQFGAVLDMVTDRCTTTCLLVFLSTAMPVWAPVFQGLITLDFASHYMHMYTCLAMGKPSDSHKNLHSRIMKIYYSKWVLFTCCAFNELFFIGLYLWCFSSHSTSNPLIDRGAESEVFHNHFPATRMVAVDSRQVGNLSDTTPLLLMKGSAPGMLIKQVVNVLQLVNASRSLVEGDRRERKRARMARAR